MNPPERFETWQEPLISLYDVLVQRAIEMGNGPMAGGWVGRKLVSGTLVTARIHDGTLELRVARGERPATEKERATWEHEVKTVERFLGLDRPAWERTEDPDAKGVAVLYRDRGTAEPPRFGRPPKRTGALPQRWDNTPA